MSNVHSLYSPHDPDHDHDADPGSIDLTGQNELGDSGEVTMPPGGFRRRASDDDNEELNDLDRARQLAESHGLPLVDLAVTGVSAEATKLVPLAVLERVGAIPYSVDENSLRIALTDPDNVNGIDELRLTSRLPVEFAVAPLEDVMVEVRRLTRANVAFAAVLGEEGFEAIEEEPDDLTAEDGISEAPIVRLVNSIVFQAAEDGASDIHLEPQEDGLLVRFRVDGVLWSPSASRDSSSVGVVTRLKVLAKLDIAERRKPQDGRITLGAGAAGRQLDIRVATLPTVYGESVVMRLLDKSKKAPTLEALGLSADMHAQLAQLVKRPTGAVLVTGPTGSGKSTTLYAALAGINNPDINVITVEDPVEYRLAGINQVQINQRAGLTFATVLRSILRSDPDVIMVGEIRDVETAKISIEAALTGHLVLSTLHTNDAPSASDATLGDGRRAVPHRLGRHGGARPAPDAEALLELRRALLPERAGAARGADRPGGDGPLPAGRVQAQGGLCPLLGHRLQGPDRRLPAARDVGDDREPRRAAGEQGRDRPCGRVRTDADALGRRDREGRRWHDDGRRARARRFLAISPDKRLRNPSTPCRGNSWFDFVFDSADRVVKPGSRPPKGRNSKSSSLAIPRNGGWQESESLIGG